MQAASTAAGIGPVTVKAVITGCSVIGMSTGSCPVTGVIGAHIAVIGTDRPSRIKAAVGCFLTGVTLGARTGIAARETLATSLIAAFGTGTVESVIAVSGSSCTDSAHTGVAVGTVEPVITGPGHIGVFTYTTIAGICGAGVVVFTVPVVLAAGSHLACVRCHVHTGSKIIEHIYIFGNQVGKLSRRRNRCQGVAHFRNGSGPQ
jgi:hypothetical protein